MAIALAMGAAAFLLTLALGYPFIGYLRRAGLGKQVRLDGPSTHLWKVGTPTLGGLLFTASVLAITAVLTLTLYRASGRSILLPMGVMLLTALLGVYDDRLSLVGSQRGGMRARTKLAVLGAVALGAALVLWHPAALGIDTIFVPGQTLPLHVGWLIVPIACLAIVGSANAVNLTDGLDGLAGHTAAVAYVGYGVIARLQGQIYLTTFCFTVAGALLMCSWATPVPWLSAQPWPWWRSCSARWSCSPSSASSLSR